METLPPPRAVHDDTFAYLIRFGRFVRRSAIVHMEVILTQRRDIPAVRRCASATTHASEFLSKHFSL